MIIFWIISFLAEKFSRQVSNVVGKRHLYCGGSDGGKLFIWNWIFKRKGSEARPRSHCFAKTLARSRINQLPVKPLVTDWYRVWSCCQYFLREDFKAILKNRVFQFVFVASKQKHSKVEALCTLRILEGLFQSSLWPVRLRQIQNQCFQIKYIAVRVGCM